MRALAAALDPWGSVGILETEYEVVLHEQNRRRDTKPSTDKGFRCAEFGSRKCVVRGVDGQPRVVGVRACWTGARRRGGRSCARD